MTIRRVEQGKSLTVRTAFLIAGDMCLCVTDLWPSTRTPSVRSAAVA